MNYKKLPNETVFSRSLTQHSTVAPFDPLKTSDTCIVDIGATHIYIAKNKPHGPPNPDAVTLHVGTTTSHIAYSVADASLTIPQVANDFPTTGHIMTSFKHILIEVGPICNTNCTAIF